MKNIAKRLDKDLIPTIDYIPKKVQENLSVEHIAKARKAYMEFVTPSFPLADQITDVVCEKRSISSLYDNASIDLYVYSPVKELHEALPALYWLHGGGTVIGGAKMDELLLKMIAKQVGCKVISVEYRLAPEATFPIPLEDCYSGLHYVMSEASKLGINPKQIAIGGQSAGGGLAAALAQLVRDRNEFEYSLVYQLLIYPMLDDRNTNLLKEGEEDHYLWTKEANAFGWKTYLGINPGTEKTPQYASAARMDNLDNLPKAMILVGEIDLFCLESIQYAQQLIANGISTELHVYPGAYHGSEGMNSDVFVSQQHNFMVFNGLQRAFKK